MTIKKLPLGDIYISTSNAVNFIDKGSLDSYINLTSITVPRGAYIVHGWISVPGVTTGERVVQAAIGWGSAERDAVYLRSRERITQHAMNSYVMLQCMMFEELKSESNPLYLKFSSRTSVNGVWGTIEAIRIN